MITRKPEAIIEARRLTPDEREQFRKDFRETFSRQINDRPFLILPGELLYSPTIPDEPELLGDLS